MPPNVWLHREFNGGELDHLRKEFISLDDIRHGEQAVLEFQVLLVRTMLADLVSQVLDEVLRADEVEPSQAVLVLVPNAGD